MGSTGVANMWACSAGAATLAKETDDFEKIVANPAVAIAGRKALTGTLRPKFRPRPPWRETRCGASLCRRWIPFRPRRRF